MSTPNPYEPPGASVAPEPVTAADSGNVAIGFAIALGLQALIIPVCIAGSALSQVLGVRGESQMVWAFVPLMFVGVFQLIYIVPAALWLRKRGKTRTLLGVLITAGVVFLLNSACYGLMLLG